MKSVLTSQILILLIPAIAGFLASWQKVLTAENNSILARIIVKITLPILLFISIATRNINTQILHEGFYVFLGGILASALLFFTAKFWLSLFPTNKNKSAIFKTHSIFGNIVFIGFPLLDSIYPGGQGLFFAACFQIASESLLWSFGIQILTTDQKWNTKTFLKHLFNINTIAFIAGLLFLLLKIPIPEIITKGMLGTGHATIYLAMVYIGALFYFINIKSLLHDYHAYLLSINKLLIVPILITVLIFTLKNMKWINISIEASTVIILQCAMPAMTVIVMLAREYGSDYESASRNVIISTFLSLISLPLIYAFCNFIFKP